MIMSSIAHCTAFRSMFILCNFLVCPPIFSVLSSVVHYTTFHSMFISSMVNISPRPLSEAPTLWLSPRCPSPYPALSLSLQRTESFCIDSLLLPLPSVAPSLFCRSRCASNHATSLATFRRDPIMHAPSIFTFSSRTLVTGHYPVDHSLPAFFYELAAPYMRRFGSPPCALHIPA